MPGWEDNLVGRCAGEPTKEATIGAGDLVTSWELGLAGACEGERRRIMMNHDMAYGEAGAFRLIPPRVSSALVKLC